MALQNIIEYITIQSTGNATDFGDLLAATQRLTGTSDATRGIIGGGFVNGSVANNVIQYITMASTGNSIDFGDLIGSNNHNFTATSNSISGVFAGGRTGGGVGQNIIQYITIQSLGNATDFGDLTVARYSLGGLSNGTGGMN